MTSFFVAGKPISKGRISYNRQGRGYYTNAAELEPWQLVVAHHARVAGCKPTLNPVHLELTFFIERPKSSKREYPTVPPDLDKFQRAVFDSLTGIAYKDDAQVVSVMARKFYREKIGVEITVSVLT